jgi:hypothetical protein
MHLTVTRDEGSPMILDVRTALNLVPVHIKLSLLLQQLLEENLAVRMTFTDGTSGTISRDPVVGQELIIPLARQISYQSPPAPDRCYDVDVKLQFGIEATVRCHAANRELAGQRVADVLGGLSMPADDEDFRIRINRNDTIEQFRKIQHILAVGDIRELAEATTFTTINRIAER